MGRTLTRYLVLQIVGPFAAGLALFTFVLLVARILKLIELVVNRGVPIEQVLLLFSYVLPAFLEVTVPMAVLLACLLAFGRLSADNEITAMRAAGIGLHQIAAPAILFGGLVSLVAFPLSLHVRPWANGALREGVFELARTRASAGLQENIFNSQFPGLTLYAEEIDTSGEHLRGLLIADARSGETPATILAREGILVSDPASQAIKLRLLDGTILRSSAADRSVDETRFVVYDISLDLEDTIGVTESRAKDVSERPFNALQQDAANLSTPDGLAASTELARRFAIPAASLVFSILAVPLGLQPVRSVRSRGLAVSLAVILIYYLLLTGAETLARQGFAPAAAMLWVPNIALGLTGLLLLWRAASERPFFGRGRP